MSQAPTISLIGENVQTTDASLTTIATIATTTNHSYTVKADIGGGSRGSSLAAGYYLAATFKNISGTVTQVGTTADLGGPHEDDTDWAGTITFTTSPWSTARR